MVEELLSCPFCGLKPRFEQGKITHCQLHGEPMQPVVVRCVCQHAPKVQAGDIHNGGYEKAKEEAVLKWNTRAPSPELAAAQARIEELEEQNVLLRENLKLALENVICLARCDDWPQMDQYRSALAATGKESEDENG